MKGRRGLPYLAVVLSMLSYDRCVSQESFDVADIARKSIVYIYFDVVDAATGAKSRIQGSGFVVTKTGFVLTAAHLFDKWAQQSAVDRAGNPIHATIGNKVGMVAQAPFELLPVNLRTFEQEDMALLKLPDSGGEPYSYAPICLEKPDLAVRVNAPVVAFGFPLDQSFQPVNGSLGTQNAPGGRWYAASAFTVGMSGGPVYSSSRLVMGMVKGGILGEDAVRWISPIQFASNLLNTAGFAQECGQKLGDQKSDVRDAPTPKSCQGGSTEVKGDHNQIVTCIGDVGGSIINR